MSCVLNLKKVSFLLVGISRWFFERLFFFFEKKVVAFSIPGMDLSMTHTKTREPYSE